MSGPLNSLAKESTERMLASLLRRMSKVEAIVQGQPIRSARIEDVGGGKVTTGTIIVKNGFEGVVLSVVDEDGVEIAIIDQNGIIVHDGAIVINNTVGNPVLDGLGVVSANNFIVDNAVSLSNPRSSSSTNFVAVPSTGLSFTLPRSTVMIFQMSGNFASTIADGETCGISVALDIDGTLYPDNIQGFGVVFASDDDAGSDVTNIYPTWAGAYFVTLPAGSHTAQLKYKKSVGSVDAQVSNTMLSYLRLGK